jgi:hypothetical protein
LFLKEYYSGDQIKNTEMGWAFGCKGERRGAYVVLVGKPAGKRPLGRLRHGW